MKPIARLYEQNGYRRASVKPGPGKPLVLLEDAEHEIERLREGLRLIACEPINAEYMAQNILDGLPAYHGAGLTHNAKVRGAQDELGQ